MRQFVQSIVLRPLLVLGLALVVASAGTLTAYAQEGNVERITLSPTHKNYKVDVGQVVSDKITIINDGTEAYDFLVYARPYSVKNEKYEPDFSTRTKDADAYSWVQFPEQTKYHLKPGESVGVPYQITVPEKAIPGGHYGVIFAETQPSDNSSGSVVRRKRVGMIVYTTVNGSYQTSGQAISSSIPFWQFQPPLHTTVSANNSGTADFSDKARLVVRDVFGNVKHDETKDYTILPQTTRLMPLDWNDASWLGLYNVTLTQTMLGRTTSAGGYVLMMPRFLPVVVAVVLLCGGIYAWYRRHKK